MHYHILLGHLYTKKPDQTHLSWCIAYPKTMGHLKKMRNIGTIIQSEFQKHGHIKIILR